jgi:hypothetical protein
MKFFSKPVQASRTFILVCFGIFAIVYSSAWYSSAQTTGSLCDLNGDQLVNVIDVQVAINQSLGVAPCGTADLNRDGQCNVIDVQLEINSVLTGSCAATQPSAPVISSFTATPSAINSGQSSTLAWSVTGATSLSIDQGIGTVTGLTSRVVTPAATTTYTLTATNSAGSATRQVLLSVNPPPSIATITLVPSTTYQTIVGWEAVEQSCQDECTNFNSFKDALFDAAVEMGLNRIRLELLTNTSCSASTWNYTDLDNKINKVITPLRTRLAAQGESLWVNLTFVDNKGCYGSGGSRSMSEYATRFRQAAQHIQSVFGWLPNSYEVALEPQVISKFWVASDVNTAIPLLRTELINAGISNPYLIAPSSAGGSNVFKTFFDALSTTNRAYLSELAYHRYDSINPTDITTRSAAAGVPPSMLEHGNANYHELHVDLKSVGVVAWEKFALAFFLDPAYPQYDRYSYFAIPSQNATTFAITTDAQFLRQYFKYIRRGAVRIEATGNSTFDPVAFRNTNGKHVVVVKAAAGGTFTVAGLPAGTYGIKFTTDSQYNVDRTDVNLTAGSTLSANIPAAGVITIYGR